MNKAEEQVIRNTIRRLKQPHAGGAAPMYPPPPDPVLHGFELVSRIYLENWMIPALERLLPESRNLKLAVDLSQ